MADFHGMPQTSFCGGSAGGVLVQKEWSSGVGEALIPVFWMLRNGEQPGFDDQRAQSAPGLF
jgi:hypothetical protein